MVSYRGFHRRFLDKRQNLGGILGGLVPGGAGSAPSTGSQQSSSSGPSSNSASLNPGGIIGGTSTLLGSTQTAALPSSGPSSVATPSALTNLSSSSTGSTSTSSPSSTHVSPSASTSSTAHISGGLSSSATSTTGDIPTSTPSASNIVYTSSDGTSIVYITSIPPAASASASVVASPPPSFLHNPSLEGGVFALVGVVFLILAFIIVTCTIRKRRRDCLERDMAVAVSFDPGVADRYEQQENSTEKRRLSGSSSGHGHGYGHGYGMQLAYAPPQEYHSMGYGRYPTLVYRTPSPNSAPYQVYSPTVPQPAAQGGANLTRKFSDRKPVPPLLPTPAYDPSNAHVSIPPQFHPQ